MNKAGIWVGLILFVFSCIFFWQSFTLKYSSDYGPGPGFFPVWLSGILGLLSILYIIETIRKEDINLQSLLPKGDGLKKVLGVFVALLFFLVIVPYTGYIIAGTIMLFILFFREFKWYWGIGLSLIVTLGLFITFDILLNIPLPVSAFGL